MSAESAPLWLRPVHRWFFWWEWMVPSIYRVLAVAFAAAPTAGLLWFVGLHPVVAVPLAVAVWIALAVAQEHDERVVVPVDAEFERLLREQVDPLLVPRGFTFNGATGSCRARPDQTDVFLYERPDEAHGCDDLWVRRDRRHGSMSVYVAGHELSRYLPTIGREEAALGLRRVEAPAADVEAIRSALLALPEEFWG